MGKSLLFNRLVGKGISLVHPEPGVTRDRLVAFCRWQASAWLKLVDTGGWEPGPQAGILSLVRAQVEEEIAQADLLLLVVDARTGVTPLDQELAQWLRKTNRPILLTVNKVDAPSLELETVEFSLLGLGEPVAVSAAHGLGIQELKERILQKLPQHPVEAGPVGKSGLRLAFVGKPNVGKSSLVNAILGENRLIVTELPGTTRDAVDIPFQWKGVEYLLIDTAGLKPRRKLASELEAKVSGRSVHAINRSQIVILVLDALTGVTEQDKKIGGLIRKALRPCLIAVNKWDLAREAGQASPKEEEAYREAVYRELFFLRFCPVVFVSARTGEGIQAMFSLLEQIQMYRTQHLPEEELKQRLGEAIERYPPPGRGKKGKPRILSLRYRSGTPSDQEVPTIVCTVSEPQCFTQSYVQFLEHHLRSVFPLTGCPIRWRWEKKP
ncbi:ribosome biogenesis GTPase Der [Candidatus Methylacidithermus pantelleriae]|uniref:ribosome biogenesis GTPase Der n=1 Tax=Candidatus Methylacidithermus pantelleriae TaxID=2744239 RepID=UPI00157D57ED|nr:ribosome biogenesis GTPase Der [Candidatus Methylacidithermus pantelleriae]